MAMYKLNKLHLHLTDDEGWRVEIPGLPELTQVGAVRYEPYLLQTFNLKVKDIAIGAGCRGFDSRSGQIGHSVTSCSLQRFLGAVLPRR